MSASRSLAATLAIYLLVPLAMNGLIFGLGWATPHPANPMLPPGWAVGSIWMALFACMGTARYKLSKASPNQARWPAFRWPAFRWLDALGILCLLYPLYTVGLRSDAIGLVGALVTAVFTAAAILAIRHSSKPATLLTAPVLLWLLYASAALAVGLRHR